jgi:hypothetical protein
MHITLPLRHHARSKKIIASKVSTLKMEEARSSET